MSMFKQLGKVIAAGILAVIILSVILCFYSLTPVHIANKDGNTDYVWEANAPWVKMTEGTAWGRFDANGYNNKTVISNPDIIVLGSSHMEAIDVMQDENVAYLLNEKLNGDYSVYNMGISGHHFFKVCQYLTANLELYDNPPKVVIIETSTVNISDSDVDEVIQSSVEFTPSHSKGIIATLQKIPFVRVLYHQITIGLLDLFMPERASTDVVMDKTEELEASTDVDEAAYDELFKYLATLEERYGTEIVIFYHPTGDIKEDGTIEFKNDESLTVFNSKADENGICFVDLTSSFEEMYYESHHVAHGFITGELEKGHLNAYGHEAAAEKLYEAIIKLEEEGKLCK